MQGVYLVAAELTYRGFIVSLTARNAYGADLLVTDGECRRTWSVQVKTNQSTSANYWLVSPHSEKLAHDTHLYVFVALKGNQRPNFLVVPSKTVAANVGQQVTKSGTWYWFPRDGTPPLEGEGWDEAFGEPAPVPASTDDHVAAEASGDDFRSDAVKE
jgi:hypothetical protein